MSFQSNPIVAGERGACTGKAADQDDHTALICATGPLDLEGAGDFRERAQALVRSSHCLVADLQHVDFIDSAGVRMLLGLNEELEEAGKELRLVINPGSRAERILRLLRLLQRFHVFPTLQEACMGGNGSRQAGE